MKIFAIIPDDYLKEAETIELNFKMDGALGKNSAGEMTLIVTVKDGNGKLVNGTQYIADLNEYQEPKITGRVSNNCW